MCRQEATSTCYQANDNADRHNCDGPNYTEVQVGQRVPLVDRMSPVKEVPDLTVSVSGPVVHHCIAAEVPTPFMGNTAHFFAIVYTGVVISMSNCNFCAKEPAVLPFGSSHLQAAYISQLTCILDPLARQC